MSLEVAIAENTAALRALLAHLQTGPIAALPAPAAEPAESPAPKARKARKAKPAPVVEAAPAPAPEPVKVEEPAKPAAPALTYDDVRIPFLTQLVARHGRDAGVALLRDFGVPEGGKLTDVPQEKWADVLAAINARSAS